MIAARHPLEDIVATTKKKATKKATSKKAASTPKQRKPSKKQRAERRMNEDPPAELKSLLNNIVEVPVTQLETHPANPRVGDVSAIAESLKENGQYRPIIVQKGTGYILGGNHTYLAARKLGWETIHAVYLDVTDERAKRIMLADNKTAELGGYDDRMLSELIASLEDPEVGTGYNADEVEELIQLAAKDVEASLGELDESDPLNDGDIDPEDVVITAPQDAADDGNVNSRKRGLDWLKERERERKKRENEKKTRDPAEVERDSDPWLEDPDAVGIQALNAPDKFSSSNEWDIPDLLPDMLMQPSDIPAKFTAWAGSATRHINDPEQWWLYNFGVDSTSGMVDKSKVVLSFFVFDDYFEEWWSDPGLYVARALNTGVQYICMPDFSPESIRAYDLYQLYRMRWMGRFFQESGLKLLPHITWPDGDIDFLRDYTLPTLPDLGLICMQLQTLDPLEVSGGMDHLKKQYQLVLNTIKPEHLIFYAGRPGREWLRDEVKPNCEVTYLNTRVEKLSSASKERKKKGEKKKEKKVL